VLYEVFQPLWKHE
jgi:hypothetical protein